MEDSILYILQLKRGTSFLDWWKLLDTHIKARVLQRFFRLLKGNPGDVVSVGEGVFEMRIHIGPGYRVYYFNEGARQIILLAGGDKSSQKRDIERAKRMFAAYKNETDQFSRIPFPGT